MRVLIGGEFSGIVREAFRARGHEALSADFEDTEQPGPHYKGDLFDVIDFPWDLAIFHFPCTHTAVSGAKHFAEKQADGRFYVGVSQFMRGWKRAAHIPRVAFEHPVSVLSTLFRAPDQIVQPWQFGHPETKATCFWLRGLNRLQPTHVVEGREGRCWKEPPSPDRWKKRSRTYPGIGDAMADQWGGGSPRRPLGGAKMKHRFTCSTHGPFEADTDKASCPTCDADPWFNTDIDAGPYGLLGGVIQKCECHRASNSRE